MASNFQNVEANSLQYCELCLDILSGYGSCRPVLCDKCKTGNADPIPLMRITDNEPEFYMKDLVRYAINITEEVETDNFRLRMKNMNNGYPENIQCKFCNGKNNACSYWQVYEDFLCKNCEWAHKRISLTKSHVIVDTAKNPDIRYLENNSLSFQKLFYAHSSIFCETNTNSKAYFYCRECRRIFCKKCNVKVHKNHSFVELEEELRHSKNSIIMKQEELKIEIDSLNESENIMEWMMQLINLKAKMQSDIIRDTFNSYTTALKKNERKLLDQTEEIRQKKLNQIDKYINESNDRLVRLKTLNLKKENSHSRFMTNDELNYFNAIRNPGYNTEDDYENDEIIFTPPDASVLNAIKCSGFIVTNSFPPHCSASGIGILRAFRNRVTHFTVHTKNHLGEEMLVGGEDVDATIQTQTNEVSKAYVKDFNNGKYIIYYYPETEGQCMISVRIRGMHIKQSPFIVTVRPYRDYRSIGNVLFTFGEEGEEDGQFSMPWGVCCDNDGHIIIADRRNHRIQVFNSDGSFKHKFGSFGSQPGEMNKPAGIAADCQDRIIVADKDNHRIQIFSLEGKFILTFGKNGKENGMFAYPWDVAVNSECNILVSDSNNHRVQLFDSNGTFINKYGYEGSLQKQFDSPRGVTFLHENIMLATDFATHRIVSINPDFVYSRFFGCLGSGDKQFCRPQGIVTDIENIIVADSRNNCIKIFNLYGDLIHKFGTFGSEPGQMNIPSGISLSPDGLIIVVDCKNNRVQVF